MEVFDELLDQRCRVLPAGEGDRALAGRVCQGQEAQAGGCDVLHRFGQQGDAESGLDQLQLGGLARQHPRRLGKKPWRMHSSADR